jgi:hypothetical protein
VRQNRLSPKEITRIVDAYPDGAATTQLARRFSISATHVSRLLHAAGVTIRSRYGR